MSARFTWPPRRADVAAASEMEMSGFLPCSFEPAETLGDTEPGALDNSPHGKELDAAAWWPELLGAMVIAGSMYAAWRGWL